MTGGPTRDGSGGGADFERLGDLLGDVTPLHAMGARARPDPATEDPGRGVARVWAEAVGPEIASNAEPLRMKSGRLVVATSSSAWAQTLQLMADRVCGRLNELLRERAVTEIIFRHAGWEKRSMGTGASARPGGAVEQETASDDQENKLTGEQKAALAEVEGLDLVPDIKGKILRAMRDSFVRGEQE